MEESKTSAPASKQPQQENFLLNIVMNLALPVLLLNKGKDWLGLDPKLTLIVALAFPVGYGVYDFVTRKNFNFVSVLGFISVLLTGGIGLLELDNSWLAFKEAGIPAVFAIVVAASAFTQKPLVKLFILNREIMDVDRIEASIVSDEQRSAFNKILSRSTLFLAGSFVVSSVLNYILTVMVVVSEPGTDAYTQELGKLQLVSYGVILVPSVIMLAYIGYYVFKGIKTLTGLGLEDLFYAAKEQ